MSSATLTYHRLSKSSPLPSALAGAAAGGWKDVTTLLTCYQHADEATILKVMESPVKLVNRPAASTLEKL